MTFSVSGILTADNVIDTAARAYPDSPQLIIWDLTNATMANMEMSDMKRIAVHLKKFGKNRANGKTAFVSQRNIDFGLFRMYIAYAELEGTPVTFSVFRTLKDAQKWLFSEHHSTTA